MADVILRGTNMEYADCVKDNAKKTEFKEGTYVKYYVQIQRAVKYANEHYTEQITLSEICKVAMMSQSAFIDSFKSIVGKTLIEYIHFLRIDLAKELLQKNQMSITEVSDICGFGDSTYFGKVFKRYTGMTPKQYRASENKE